MLTHTRTTGKQETSTDQEQLSIGANASGGGSFGAFSASVSASLNRSSSSQHQVTVTAQSSVFESIEIDNTDHDDVLTVLFWQLTDLIDVWTVDGVHLGHVAQGQDPVVATQHRAAVPQRPRRTPDTARTPV